MSQAIEQRNDPTGLCTGAVKVQKILGGGASWYYALCSCGYILGASHQDDCAGMNRLQRLRMHNTQSK